MKTEFETLIAAALEARKRAYAPYSKFAVGAAVLSDDGEVFTGCNVENLSFGLTLCAERNALASAVATGQRKFQALAVVADSREPISPCGACRQVMAEFGDYALVAATLGGDVFESTVEELLPRARTGILDLQDSR